MFPPERPVAVVPSEGPIVADIIAAAPRLSNDRRHSVVVGKPSLLRDQLPAPMGRDRDWMIKTGLDSDVEIGGPT
jgi:hypothetical protein